MLVVNTWAAPWYENAVCCQLYSSSTTHLPYNMNYLFVTLRISTEILLLQLAQPFMCYTQM